MPNFYIFYENYFYEFYKNIQYFYLYKKGKLYTSHLDEEGRKVCGEGMVYQPISTGRFLFLSILLFNSTLSTF